MTAQPQARPVDPRRSTHTAATMLVLVLLVLPRGGSATPEPHVVPTPAGHEFHFVVLGDSQFHDAARFNRLIDDIRHLNPAFVIQVGDMIEGYAQPATVAAEWIRFRQQIAPLGTIPFMPVPGNHDLYNPSRTADPVLEALYLDQWGATYYAFDYQHARFIVLNTDGPGAERRIGPDQWQWLQTTLAEAANRPVLVFMHRPPATLENGPALHALLRDHGVRYVFYGHQHHYHFEERDGIRYVMTNAAATGALDFAETGSFHHFLLVTVRDDDIRYAIVPAETLRAPTSVTPTDNYDLFDIHRQLAPGAIALTPTAAHRWEFAVPLRNPTERMLDLYIQCGSADHRWRFTPTRVPPQRLAPGAETLLRLMVDFAPDRVPESVPRCTIQLPYQTSQGAWVTYERTLELTGY
jgi:hypothetical protein